jgi:hypothetical protein
MTNMSHMPKRGGMGLQMVELEAMLFGNKAAQLDNFSREHEQDLDLQAVGPSHLQVGMKTGQAYHPLLYCPAPN